MHLDLRSRASDEQGITIVEALVGGILLVIGILGGISVFDSSRRESATGERQQIAVLQAQEELERMRDVPYADLAVDPAVSWTPSGAPGDPTARVNSGTPTTFDVGPNETEDLVFAASGGPGIPAQTSFELTAGDSALDVDVYRFVSWKDEECPVVDLSGVVAPVENLTDQSTSLVDALLASSSSLEALLGPLLALLHPVIGDRLDFARDELTAIEAALDALAATVAALDEIDPCDADVAALEELQDTLAPLNPLLTELNSRINAYHAGCLKVLGVYVSCPGTGSSRWTNLNTTITNLQNADYQAAIAGLIDSLDEIAAADHTHNTKRVTVAVVLDPRTGSGPIKPVWATSVVSDLGAGLVSGP